ncbi:minor tail protein [Mycobacterium phage MooMoo]|uniref:Minor tail protein n=1 Tax=Mycobacterium phage MooMoo TaxID=2108127 RepID=A0A2P1JR95_9CAUD|nr:minor tail protein [Mycobacterium phage MooMoo]AVO21622.1 minor tail protein [Mycobacterium phage MooMoo]
MTTYDIAALNEKIKHGTLEQVAEASVALARHQDEMNTDWTFTLCDEFWGDIGDFGADLMEASGTDPMNDKAAATFKLKGSSDYIGALNQCETTLRGVIVETAGIRLPYYVDTHDWANEKAAWTGTANCVGIWDILNYLIIWPSWFLPLQVQPFSHAIFVGPIVTVIENMISECAFRVQAGINEFLNNALSLNPDVRAWFGSILQAISRDGLNPNAILEMLKTPMYVVRTNPFLDGSPLVAKTVRMESCGTTIRELTKAYGVVVDVSLWRPGDPQPDRWANLTKPTYVVTVKDRSQISGPTHTILDSIFRTTVDLGGSLGSIFYPIIRQVQSMPGVYESPALGVNFTPPYAVVVAPEHGDDSPLVSCKITKHTPKAWQIIIGGKSPKWLNDLINATLSWLIDSISIIIGFTGIPSNLLDGFLNDAFFAFQLLQHYGRRAQMGPMHPNIEIIIPTNSAPYNVEAVFTFLNALWDTRGYTSAQAVLKNAPYGPYALGRDVARGMLTSIIYPEPDPLTGGTKWLMFTDHITNTPWKYSPKDRELMLIIGDGKAEEASIAKHQRFIQGLFEAFNVATLAPRS